MKKYILFDNDGVLVDTEKWYFKSNRQVLHDMGITLTQERYIQIMINGQSAFLLAQQEGFSAQDIKKAKDQRNRLYQHYIQTQDIEIPGVCEVLRHLSKTFKMGIVTSSRREDFELIHKTKSLTEHMKFVLCSGEYERSKPHPDPYLKGLAHFSGQKHEAIVVEDSQRGLTSAYSAGIDCVIVHNHFTRAHDFSKATHLIQTLNELEALL